MIRSMTGYGEAERESAAGRLRAEVRTVNHRFFSANVRVPPALDRYEVRIRDWLRTYIARGHVNCSVRVDTADGVAEGTARLEFDEARARGYAQALRALKERLDLPGPVDMALLARVNGLVVQVDTEDSAAAVSLEDLRQVIEAAAAGTVAMREEEGLRLEADIEQRLRGIEAALESIAQRLPARLVAERDRMRAAVAELAGDVGVDEERLAREIAYLAERWDVSEELVRLRSHIELFRQTLEGLPAAVPGSRAAGADVRATDTRGRTEGSAGRRRAAAPVASAPHTRAGEDASAEPIGKRLGFLNQEMHREANTIASKANDAAIEHQVVAIKNEIERLREQIENVE